MRRRLVISIAAVAAAAVALLALPLAVILERSYRDEEVLRLQRDTVAATREVDIAKSGTDPIELPHSDDQIAVYDLRGSLVSGDGPATADALTRRAIESGRISQSSTGNRFSVAVPLLVHERVSGVLRAERDESAVTTRVNKARLALGALALGIIAVAAFAALLVSRRLAAPLERLAVAARRLGDGDFSVRAPRFAVEEANQVGEALSLTAKRLGDLLARERAFSADASHQLRTPLAALRLELESLEIRGNAPPEVTRALGEVDRLQHTIETLLELARDAPTAPGRTDLSPLLRETEQRWHGPLAEAGRPLRIQDPGGLVAGASPRVVSEVLEVLLQNATVHGEGTVTITARESAIGSVSIDVADEGPGLFGDPESVFARRVGSDSGHGIGLHLARSLADAEGGRLTVSATDSGPRFTLLLPGVEP